MDRGKIVRVNVVEDAALVRSNEDIGASFGIKMEDLVFVHVKRILKVISLKYTILGRHLILIILIG